MTKTIKKSTYKAAVLKQPMKITFENKPIAELKKGEALIRISHAGICGTDIAIFSGLYKVPLPLVLGHEWTGTIEQINHPRTTLVGKRVTGEINNTCLSYRGRPKCPACEMNLPSHCIKRNVTGIIDKDGAFAQYMVVPVNK